MKRSTRQHHNRQQHAIRRQDVQERQKRSSRRFLRWTILILILSLSIWGWLFLRNPENFPIEKVQIRGNYSHLNPNRLKEILMPYVDRGLFNVDIQGMQERLLAFPWVKEADVSRRWPHTLMITITEQRPVAIWNKNSLINSEGTLFSPKESHFPTHLPMLVGPEGKQQDLLKLYNEVVQALKSLNLGVMRLNMSDREAITLILSNGIELILGKQDIMARLMRFVGVYHKVFPQSGEIVDVVDMRYTNGMAVGRKNGEETE